MRHFISRTEEDSQLLRLVCSSDQRNKQLQHVMYQQLTEGKRYQILALLEQGVSIENIALGIDCHRSSLYRELSRNSGKTNYCPQIAHKACIERRCQTPKYKIPSERAEFILLLIKHNWIPEQISEVLTASGMPVSHEWIYSLLRMTKQFGESMCKN